jgi:hypothetical protein
MTLAFLLSMPHAASWNGKWSGEGQCYALLRKFPNKTAERIYAGSPYFYRWPDGWCAEVEVQKPNAADSRKLRKATKGFWGCEWMVDSIFLRGKILADREVKELQPTSL